MGFDWRFYLILATKLASESEDKETDLKQAYYRSSISRAYYGVFCIARNKLKQRRIKIPLTDTHKFIREQYINSSHDLEKKIGEVLKRLWKHRKDADYEDDVNFNKNLVEFILRQSNEILDKLKSLR